MTDITNIPLSKLTAWEGNVRKTQNKGFVEELAASIKAHGLQQNLVVKKHGKKFAVIAGGQRLKALNRLAETGDLKANYPVPCRIIEDDAAATELSLAENVVRDAMHPADQFDAFCALIDKGATVEDVAARFGVSDTVVAQRLKLARVSPAILGAYREERLNLEHVMAFAVSDDHAAQERVLAEMPPWTEARDIRAALTENDIAASDKRVRFVTLKAYEKAGGTVRRDLFAEEDDGVFILDVALLDRLAREKLERAAKPVCKEGWKWVETHFDFGYEVRSQFHREFPELAPLSPEDAATLEQLEQERETLLNEWEAAGDDAERPDRLDEIDEQLDRLNDRDEVWTPETLAIAGAVVTIGHDGDISVERGLVRREDMKASKAGGSADRKTAKVRGAGTASDDEQSAAFSAALIEQLTAQKSAAISAELLERPGIALAAVVYAFAAKLVLGECEGSAVQITASPQSLLRVEGSKAFEKMEAAREKWKRELPPIEQLWPWCILQDEAVLLSLLSFCVAMTVNAVKVKNDRVDCGRLVHADKLASAQDLDMKQWFTPTAENYFSRINKGQILDALREAKGTPPAPAWEKLKKPDLAALAERETAGTGWLPPPLR